MYLWKCMKADKHKDEKWKLSIILLSRVVVINVG